MNLLTHWTQTKRRGCTEEYVLLVKRAITMFRHCWVYDEPTESVINHSDEPDGPDGSYPFDIQQYLDPKPDATQAMGVYSGELHPMSIVWSIADVSNAPTHMTLVILTSPAHINHPTLFAGTDVTNTRYACRNH